MKMKVMLAEGFRFHRLDNTFVDLKKGDVIEADEIPLAERTDRIMSQHIIPAATEPVAAAPPTEKPVKGKK